MAKTIKARYSRGVIEPLKDLNIEEGKELVITIEEFLSRPDEAFKKSAGAGGT